MSRRSRIIGYGGSAILVVGGVIAGALAGSMGQIIAFALIGVGLVLAVSLVFYEVGLSEDREREREQRRARREQARTEQAARVRPKLGRMRGRSRRLDK